MPYNPGDNPGYSITNSPTSQTTGAPSSGGYADARPIPNGGGQQYDFDREDRSLAALMAYQGGSLAEQKAARKAQDAYNKKKLELERQGLGLQADQLAKQYAMDQARLEWDKAQFAQQFGQSVKQQDIDNRFRDRELSLDDQWRTAEQTGFRDGAPTLAKLQFNEQTRQFDAGQAVDARNFAEQVRQYGQDFGEDARRFNEQFSAEAGRYTKDFEEAQRLANLGQQNNQRDFGESQRQYNQNFGEDARRYNQDFGEDARRYNQDFGEDTRRFDVGQGNNERDFAEEVRQYGQNFGEGQRQYNVSAVMNAPRGPADWAAYTARVRGLQSSGGLPGAVGTMFDPSAQVASYSNSGQQTGPVLSNTDLAMSMTGQSDGSSLTGTPWVGMANGGQGQPQSSNSSSPYGETERHGAAPQSTVSNAGAGAMSLPSIQKFRRYNPTEQQMGLGYMAENGGPTEDDANYLMQRQAPNYERSRTSRMAGV